MSRLPTVSSDGNAWGTILNDFLSQAHNADGSIKNLFYNVKDPAYGAKGDGKTVTNGAITTGTPTLTSATAAFTAADVGKQITVLGAGAAGVSLNTTISAFVNATTVTLAINAGTTVSAATVSYATDDTTAIATALTAASAAGGGTVILPGLFGISASLTVPTNMQLLGCGPGTGLKALGNFSGAQMVLCNGNYAVVASMSLFGGVSATSSANPATNGVQVTGALWVTLRDVFISAVNGWAAQYQATAGNGVFGGLCDNVLAVHCKNGLHFQGHSAQSYAAGCEITNCFIDHIDIGECFFFEDAGDMLLSQSEGNESGATAAALHLKGNTGIVYIATCDFGNFAGANGSNVLIESGTNGSPAGITFTACVIQFGTPGLTISSGQDMRFIGCDFIWNVTHGVNVSGGDTITFDTCTFNNNGTTAAATNYDFQTSTGGNIRVTNCTFLTPQGVTANHVLSAINDTAFALEVYQNNFAGVGMIPTRVFAGFPKYIRNCKGYNPVGVVGATVPASGVNFATNSNDATYYVTGGTVSSIKIGGSATGLTSGTFRVFASQTLNITYTVVPTVTCFLE